MRNLAKYHARGIHQWDGGECDFHPILVCSCGDCPADGERKCDGKPYESQNTLRCELHALAYEIECNHRADHAAEIIDPELGRGHSNLCEATFSVVAKFRAKDTNVHRVHYQTSTNLGLIQSSMTFLYERRGRDYHWVLDLYRRMGLPQFVGLKEFVSAVYTNVPCLHCDCLFISLVPCHCLSESNAWYPLLNCIIFRVIFLHLSQLDHFNKHC